MKLPNISARECLKTLYRAGYVLFYIRGSHYYLMHETTGSEVIVPFKRNIRRSTMRRILAQAGLSVAAFQRLRGKGE